MLTRGQVSRRLGLSIARIRQLQDDGTLRSRVDHRGWHLFDRDEIEELRRTRARARGGERDDGLLVRRGVPACAACGLQTIWLWDPETAERTPQGVCRGCKSNRGAHPAAPSAGLPRDLRGRRTKADDRTETRWDLPTLEEEPRFVEGTRVPLRAVLVRLAEGASRLEILGDFPELTGRRLRTAIRFAAAAALGVLRRA
jgi:hypothetical protein